MCFYKQLESLVYRKFCIRLSEIHTYIRLAIPFGIQNIGSLKLLKTAMTKNAVDAVKTLPVRE